MAALTAILLLAATMLVGSCRPKAKAPDDARQETSVDVDSVSVRAALDSLMVVDSRAAIDSAYAGSEEYHEAHAAYDRIIDRLTEGEGDAGRILTELGYAIELMQTNGRYFATHSSEMAKPVNQQRMMLNGEKVKRLRQQLIQMKLTDEERGRLDSLNAVISF